MPDAGTVHVPPSKPLLIFDGDCGFCRLWITRWRETTGNAVEYLPYQAPEISSRVPEISRDSFARAVHFIDCDGRTSSGAEAVFRSLDRDGRGMLRRAYEHVPGFAAASELVYRLVADHRTTATRVTRLAWGSSVERSTFLLVRSLFLRLLGAIYLTAFVSLWLQIDGLVGQAGILPAEQFLASASAWGESRQIGLDLYRIFPTLAWISASDRFLHLLCAGGAVGAGLLISGIAPALMAVLLWLDYLSLSVVCREFLSFQWDALLLETGLLAVLASPWTLSLTRASAPPTKSAVWLLRWLLFRLMLSSGVVKLASGDPTWRSLSALAFHYETQPLPTWIGWYAHQLPLWFHKLSVVVMFGIELGLPWLIFAPRRLRAAAAVGFVLFQVLIGATGNYCFFGLLTVLLCVPLLDDRMLRSFIPRPWRDGLRIDTAQRMPRHPGGSRWIGRAVATVIVIVSSMELAWAFRTPVAWPTPMLLAYTLVEPFRSINGYGLFMVMTTSRPEIVLQGSNDGKDWRSYEFRYKPGVPARRPGFVAPHQPRLDWQMWFAALGTYDENPWFQRFCRRLLEGSPPVLELLAVNPFPDHPPQYLRAVLYEYRFTSLQERRATGNWWRLEKRGLYSPVLSR